MRVDRFDSIGNPGDYRNLTEECLKLKNRLSDPASAAWIYAEEANHRFCLLAGAVKHQAKDIAQGS